MLQLIEMLSLGLEADHRTEACDASQRIGLIQNQSLASAARLAHISIDYTVMINLMNLLM